MTSWQKVEMTEYRAQLAVFPHSLPHLEIHDGKQQAARRVQALCEDIAMARRRTKQRRRAMVMLRQVSYRLPLVLAPYYCKVLIARGPVHLPREDEPL